MTLDEFFESPLRNGWVRSGNRAEWYLRKSQHVVKGEIKRTFDFSNAIVHRDQHRGKGIFSKAVKQAMVLVEQHPDEYDGIYFENVQPEQLRHAIVRWGAVWAMQPVYMEANWPPSFFLPLDKFNYGKFKV